MTERYLSIHDDIGIISKIPSIPHILKVICDSTGMGFATVARVTDVKWVACAVEDQVNFGLKVGGELKLETTICNEIREHQNPVVIDDVKADPAYANHPTPKIYGLQSYISLPILLKDGYFYGTLCAIDSKPANLNNEKTISMFKLFADLIAYHIDSIVEVADVNSLLAAERNESELREQFIAILGHDMRNPLHAISNAAELLLRAELDKRSLLLSRIIRDSTARAIELVDNVMDFTKGKLGGGIELSRVTIQNINQILNQIVDEIKVAYPNRSIEANFKIDIAVTCDSARISQLLSNLLSNALIHGSTNGKVLATAHIEAGEFCLCVSNSGNKISEITIKHLFEPFSRGKVHEGKEGLGLGLYIVSEIAKAHLGKVTVASTDEQTCFKFTFPI